MAAPGNLLADRLGSGSVGQPTAGDRAPSVSGSMTAITPRRPALWRSVAGRLGGAGARVDPNDPAAVAQAIAGFPVVTCDIFDTAVMRRLARPQDVHLATGARALAAGLSTASPAAFREYRLGAEHAARAELELPGGEVAIAEIYRRLEAAGVVTDAAAAAALEFAVERSVCCAVPAVRSALAARPPGQRLIFLSDTVLPGAWLATLLTDCGYLRPEVMCSADVGRNKVSGGLFRHLVETLGVPARNIVHLGDNPQADVARAREAGLAALHLPAPHISPEPDRVARQSYVPRLAFSRQRSRPALREADGVADAAVPGALCDPRLLRSCFGVLLGFTLFVLAEARRRGIRRIFFTARDGYLPLAMAQRLLARREEAFELTYLQCSRQAIMLPTLADDLPKLSRTVANGLLGRPLRYGLNAIGIDAAATAEMARAIGLEPDRPMEGQRGEATLLQLITAHRDRVLAALQQRRDAALGYLGQCGFLEPGPRMVVDVGWRGSVQKALTRLVGAAPGDIVGSYVGLWPEALCPELGPTNAAGYLFTFGDPRWIADIVRQGYVLFELYFSAPHGPVSHYAWQDGCAAPVYASGPAADEAIRRHTVLAIEQSCLAEFDRLDAILDGAWPEQIDAESALGTMVPLLTRPHAADVAAINRVPYIHGIDGTFNVQPVNRVPLHQFVRDVSGTIRRISASPWQAGALRASLPWPAPNIGFPEFADRAERLLRRFRLAR